MSESSSILGRGSKRSIDSLGAPSFLLIRDGAESCRHDERDTELLGKCQWARACVDAPVDVYCFKSTRFSVPGSRLISRTVRTAAAHASPRSSNSVTSSSSESRFGMRQRFLEGFARPTPDIAPEDLTAINADIPRSWDPGEIFAPLGRLVSTCQKFHLSLWSQESGRAAGKQGPSPSKRSLSMTPLPENEPGPPVIARTVSFRCCLLQCS
jgi:hypothetical protein